MEEGVGPIQDRQHGLVAFSEEGLHSNLAHGEQEAKGTILLKVQNSNTVALSHLPHSISGKDEAADTLDADVEEQVDGPVEHLNQEGKLLYEAAVGVVGVSHAFQLFLILAHIKYTQ